MVAPVGNPCGICGGPNDIGEVCDACAKAYPEQTMAGAFAMDPKDYQRAQEWQYGDDRTTDREPEAKRANK